MTNLTFQFWADSYYQDYGADEQIFLNCEFSKSPRPDVVQLSGSRYELQGFTEIESGNAVQVNKSTGFRRHVMLRPVYMVLHSYPQLPVDTLRFQYDDNGWQEYTPELQRQFRDAVRCAPRPRQVYFSAKGNSFHSYRLLGLETLDAAGCGQLSQVNTMSGKSRAVRAIISGAAANAGNQSASRKIEFAVLRGGKLEGLHPDAYSALKDALLASGPRADRVQLPSGDTVENFLALEAGRAGVSCNGGLGSPSGDWIPVQLCLPGGDLPMPARGRVVVPDELEHADLSITAHGEFCVLARKSPECSQQDEKVCAICLSELEPDDEGDMCMEEPVFQLRCGHLFHAPCLEEWFKSKQRCPQCQTNFGKVIGNGPRVGSMSWRTEQMRLPGHPESAGSIVVEFDFPPGTDESGARYEGRRERGYLPGNATGCLLLELFKTALCRRVMFGLGNSMTTGAYRPTFNIHIKTSVGGGAVKHGYPDPDYFQRAFEELRNAGVSVADWLRD